MIAINECIVKANRATLKRNLQAGSVNVQ
jgi:hypothetical protein